MIKLSIPFTKDNKILSLVNDKYLDYIEEIYMPVPNEIIASARPYEANEASVYADLLESQIKLAKDKGLKVTFVANKQFIDYKSLRKTSVLLCDFLKKMKEKYDIDKVIISNLYILRQYGTYIKSLGIEIELSVLMGIRSVESFEQIMSVVPFATSICLSDAFVHDIDAMRYIKKMYPDMQIKLIPNHGCFVNCASEHQHHNYCASTMEAENGNSLTYSSNSELNIANGLCATCGDKFGHDRLLNNVSFIRPNDAHLYDGVVDLFKISGRTHPAENIIRTVEAYIDESYSGSLSDLLDISIGVEPGVINDELPNEIGARRSNCNHKCYKCHYCEMIDNFKKSHIVSDNIEV